MGHYDSAYEHDEDKRRKEYAKRIWLVKCTFDDFRKALGSGTAPQGIEFHIEDVKRWIDAEVQSTRD